MKGIIFVVVFIALLCGVAGRVRREDLSTLDQILTTNHTEFVKLLNTYNPSLYNSIKSATSTNALTLFVPTDAAIKEALNGKIPNATNTLDYHAHRGDLVTFYFKNFNTIPTLYVSPRLPGPQVLSFSAVNGTSNVTIINYQAQIIGADVPASNGMIHVIDQVLNVPYEDVIRAADIGNFKHLQELVKIANFTDPESTANVTLLAPTDIAFTALYTSQPILKAYFAQNKLPTVKSTIQNLLTKHLVKGVFYPATLANGTTFFDSVFGTETKVDKTSNNITVSLAVAKATVAAVTIPNLIAADGVAHGIDQVLTVPGQGLLSLSDILNTLNATNYIARLNATGLHAILEDNTPRTYFVPLDSISGVNSLNASDILYGIAQLPNVIFSGRYIDSSLILPSLDNSSQQLFVETAPINNVTRAPKVNGIIATGPAITNKGSYVYSINTLLIVPGVPENVLNAAGDNNFTAFTSLYTEKTLSNTGLYDINNNKTTLFVPTNEAFSKLPLGVVGFLRANDTTAKQYATALLNNHIVEDELLYNINQGLTQLVSANKGVLNLNRTSGGITISGPGYTGAVNPAALLTNNGAAFPIDSVLVPPAVRLTAEEILKGLAFENTTGDSLGKYYTSIQQFDQVGLLDLLRSTNQQYTLFVYTDAAWENAVNSYEKVSNKTDEFEQLTNIINYGIVYGDSVQDLNKSNVLVPGHNSNSTITVIQAGPDEKTKVSLKTLQGTYEATVVVSTVTGYNQAIYGLDRVLGVDTKDTSKGNKLPTWAWVVIIVGGILIGLLILAVIVGAAWYLFVRPNREGYRHIN